MPLTFTCRNCGNSICGDECGDANLKPTTTPAIFMGSPNVFAPYAQSDTAGARPAAGDARLAQAADALRSASAAVGRERMLRDRTRQGLCANGQTKEARRNSMKIFMRRYRRRRRAEQVAALGVMQVGESAATA